ncbi:MAG: hypothetical protein AAF242_04780 [Bacteroidota bacterium]
MALRKFIKLPKHQQYQYKPRYWDPEKEKLHERLQKIEDLKGGGQEGMKARISSGLKRGYLADSRQRNKALTRSNLLLLAVVIGLLGLAYTFLTVYLPVIVDKIEGGG